MKKIGKVLLNIALFYSIFASFHFIPMDAWWAFPTILLVFVSNVAGLAWTIFDYLPPAKESE